MVDCIKQCKFPYLEWCSPVDIDQHSVSIRLWPCQHRSTQCIDRHQPTAVSKPARSSGKSSSGCCASSYHNGASGDNDGNSDCDGKCEKQQSTGGDSRYAIRIANTVAQSSSSDSGLNKQQEGKMEKCKASKLAPLRQSAAAVTVAMAQ